MAINGDEVVIGHSEDIDKGPRSGAAYIFNLSADSLNRESPTDKGGLIIAGSANIVGVNITHDRTPLFVPIIK